MDSELPRSERPLAIPSGQNAVRHARTVATYLTAGVFVCTNGRDKSQTKTLVERTIPSIEGVRGETKLVLEAARLLGPLELFLLYALAGIAFACSDQPAFALVTKDTTDDVLKQVRDALYESLTDGEHVATHEHLDVITGVTTRAILRQQLAKSCCGANITMVDEGLEGLEGFGTKEIDARGNKTFTRALKLSRVSGDENQPFRFALDWRITMAIAFHGNVQAGVQFVQISLQEHRALSGKTAAAEVAQLLHPQIAHLVREGEYRPRDLDDFVELAYGPFKVKGLTAKQQRQYVGRTRVQEITVDTLKRRRTAVRSALSKINEVCDWIEIRLPTPRGRVVELSRPKRITAEPKDSGT